MIFVGPNKAGRTETPDSAALTRKQREDSANPGLCPLGDPPTGGRVRRGSLCTAVSRVVGSRASQHAPTPPFRTQGGVEKSCCRAWGRRSAAAGEGGSAWGGGNRERKLRPPPAPEGKGRRWPVRTELNAAASAVGAPGHDPAAPSGWERAPGQRGHVSGPSSLACLPRAPGSPFINSPPAPRPPGAGARRERREAARPPPMGRAPRD